MAQGCASSGDVLDLVEVAVNCEQNSLLYKVRKAGTGVCHTKDAEGNTRQTCYYRTCHRPRDPHLRLMQIRPTFEEFAALAADHSVVPVWAEVLADLTTPVAAFARVVGDEEGFLLESVDNGDRWSSLWSFIGRRPQGTLVSKRRSRVRGHRGSQASR